MFKAIAAWWKLEVQERRDALVFERQVVVRLDDVRVSVAYPGLLKVEQPRRGAAPAAGWRVVPPRRPSKPS
ncbi:hypothetical protein [Thauera sinica]|uniref:Uncharacterized protein n=1 Tax=Thauera sinica TaxID=2665146 RepID=A0ABW1ASI4_9RHOO|nr:hypothetical protein [Thauera sp. K11]